MSIRIRNMTSMVAAGGLAVGILSAPVANAVVDDPCATAVSSSRCLGPTGVKGFSVPKVRSGAPLVGPYGPWGWMPPLG